MHPSEALSKMTIEEKINLCCGADFWHSVAFEKHGIPAMTVADGPHGLRFQQDSGDMLGIHSSVPATCFPTAAATGLSWDRELVREIGEAIGKEALSYGVDTVLGPGLNIKRSPLCGRNFEYYSEDPYLSGQLGASYVKGMQATGTGACLKHFAANSQEYKRFSSNDHMDQRSLREIYLPAFEETVKAASPAMVMCAYNKINGTYCSDNKWLLTDVLRNEWGFQGMVLTDWGAMHDRVKGFQAGCDWSMPGGTNHLQKHAMAAYRAGVLTETEIDVCAERILKQVLASQLVQKQKKDFDREAHHGLARKAAAESAVLLKNEGLLPLATSSVALIGHMAKVPRYQGTGSSHIRPTKLTSLCDAAPAWAFAPGCDERGDTNEELVAQAILTAKSASVAVVVVGLPQRYESEGFDRDSMALPDGHSQLIEAVAAANPNTVVVLLCGSPIEAPWIDKVKALLYMGLPGQAGGGAIFDILTGKVTPGGKLTETWPLRYEDAPCSGYYGAPHKDAQYREGIYVGYRYYETAAVPVRFPFGFGLSFTEFTYSDMQMDGNAISVQVTNAGKVPGAEIVQLYIAPPRQGIHRPAKELKGFEKVFLQPKQTKRVSFPLSSRCFSLWTEEGWHAPQGDYEIQIGSSVRDVRFSQTRHVEGESLPAPVWQEGSWYAHPQGQPSKKTFETMLGRALQDSASPRKSRFTMDSTIAEMAEHSLSVRLMAYFMKKTIAKMNGGKADFDDPTFRMAYTSSVDSSLFSVVNTSGGSMPEALALGLLEIANGHWFGGIRRILKKEPSFM